MSGGALPGSSVGTTAITTSKAKGERRQRRAPHHRRRFRRRRRSSACGWRGPGSRARIISSSTRALAAIGQRRAASGKPGAAPGRRPRIPARQESRRAEFDESSAPGWMRAAGGVEREGLRDESGCTVAARHGVRDALAARPRLRSRAASGLWSMPRPETGGAWKAGETVALGGVFGRVVIAANTLWRTN